MHAAKKHVPRLKELFLFGSMWTLLAYINVLCWDGNFPQLKGCFQINYNLIQKHWPLFYFWSHIFTWTPETFSLWEKIIFIWDSPFIPYFSVHSQRESCSVCICGVSLYLINIKHMYFLLYSLSFNYLLYVYIFLAMGTKSWVSRVHQSKFEANRSRGSCFMIGQTNRQTVCIFICMPLVQCRSKGCKVLWNKLGEKKREIWHKLKHFLVISFLTKNIYKISKKYW